MTAVLIESSATSLSVLLALVAAPVTALACWAQWRRDENELPVAMVVRR